MSDLLEFIREIKDLPLDMKNKLIEMRSKQMELDHIQAKLELEKNKVNIGEIETKKENEGTYADLNVDANANDETRELCGVCCSPIVDPIFLNCLHRFCSKCFDSFPEHNVVNCPLCRHPIEIEREINMIFQESTRDYIRELRVDIFNCTLQWYAVDVYINYHGFRAKIRLPDKEKKEIDKVIDICNNYLSNNGIKNLDRVYFYERHQGTKQFMDVFNRSGFIREGIYKADITLTIHSIKYCVFSGTRLNIHLNEIHIKGGEPPHTKTCSII